jgi:hypothetical protein
MIELQKQEAAYEIYDSAKDIIALLDAIWSSHMLAATGCTIVDKIAAENAFSHLRQQGDETVHQYLQRYKDSIDRMSKVGVTVPPAEELAVRFLQSLSRDKFGVMMADMANRYLINPIDAYPKDIASAAEFASKYSTLHHKSAAADSKPPAVIFATDVKKDKKADGGKTKGRGGGRDAKGRGGRGGRGGDKAKSKDKGKSTGEPKDLSHIECYNCHEFGHYKSKCPQEIVAYTVGDDDDYLCLVCMSDDGDSMPDLMSHSDPDDEDEHGSKQGSSDSDNNAGASSDSSSSSDNTNVTPPSSPLHPDYDEVTPQLGADNRVLGGQDWQRPRCHLHRLRENRETSWDHAVSEDLRVLFDTMINDPTSLTDTYRRALRVARGQSDTAWPADSAEEAILLAEDEVFRQDLIQRRAAAPLDYNVSWQQAMSMYLPYIRGTLLGNTDPTHDGRFLGAPVGAPLLQPDHPIVMIMTSATDRNPVRRYGNVQPSLAGMGDRSSRNPQ